MEELVDLYTARVLAGDEKGAEEIVELFPGETGDLRELLGLVKELSLIYRPLRPSARFREDLLRLLRARFRPSPLNVLVRWARQHRQEIAIGAAIAGSACSIVGIIAYFTKVRKAAA